MDALKMGLIACAARISYAAARYATAAELRALCHADERYPGTYGSDIASVAKELRESKWKNQ